MKAVLWFGKRPGVLGPTSHVSQRCKTRGCFSAAEWSLAETVNRTCARYDPPSTIVSVCPRWIASGVASKARRSYDCAGVVCPIKVDWIEEGSYYSSVAFGGSEKGCKPSSAVGCGGV